MQRREFIAGVATVAAWPLAAHAQQPAMPVVGFLGSELPDLYVDRLRAFRQGLSEASFVEGRNVAIEYRAMRAASICLFTTKTRAANGRSKLKPFRRATTFAFPSTTL
jgi:hypothetical protein